MADYTRRIEALEASMGGRRGIVLGILEYAPDDIHEHRCIAVSLEGKRFEAGPGETKDQLTERARKALGLATVHYWAGPLDMAVL